MRFSIHQASHIGNRRYNQDRVAYAYTNDALLMVLADGMGGHLHGEVAAGLTIDTFVESFGAYAQARVENPQQFITETMHHAHERIIRLPHNSEMGGAPGTTCVAVLVQDGSIYWGYAGDSRLYLLRDGEVLIRSEDHSVVQHWVRSGKMTDEEAREHPQRNQITNCLGGIDDIFYVEKGEKVALQPRDVVLLGSDGLWGPFSDQELAAAFYSGDIADALDKLVVQALQREAGHSDNITGIAVRWGDSEAMHHTQEPVSYVLEIV